MYCIKVYKSDRILNVCENDKTIRSYPIQLGFNPLGHKEFEGDGKTPEGIYYIDGKNLFSKFFLNLGISYPNEDDKKHALKHNQSAGGLIKIHGEPKDPSQIEGYPKKDWTKGCIALSNNDMKELFDLIPIGTTILIAK